MTKTMLDIYLDLPKEADVQLHAHFNHGVQLTDFEVKTIEACRSVFNAFGTTPPAMEQAAKFFYIRALAAMNTQEVQVTDTSETRGTVVKPIDNTGARLAMKTICPSVGFDDERFEQILINQIRRTPPYNLKGSL